GSRQRRRGLRRTGCPCGAALGNASSLTVGRSAIVRRRTAPRLGPFHGEGRPFVALLKDGGTAAVTPRLRNRTFSACLSALTATKLGASVGSLRAPTPAVDPHRSSRRAQSGVGGGRNLHRTGGGNLHTRARCSLCERSSDSLLQADRRGRGAPKRKGL